MREGDQNHHPYLTSVHGHRCLLSIVDLVRDEGVEAVWQMERGDQWFITFKDSTVVDNWDGKSFKPPNLNVTLHMYACDRLIVRCRVLWLPLRVTNEDIHRVFDKYGDIKDIKSA